MSVKAAVRLAQSMLAAAGADVKEDGVLGPETVRAYRAAALAVRSAIQDAVNRWESLDFTQMVNSYKGGSANAAPRAGNAVDLSKPAFPGSTGSGWEGRLSARMRLAGVPEGSLRAIKHQVKVETGGRLMTTEDHRYAPAWLRAKVRKFKNMSDEDIRALQRRGPQAFFNFAYGDRVDLGNRGEASGDGYKYRGRGPFQLTGRNNYERVGRLLGIDLVADPDWIVRSEDNAIASAVAYLKMNGKLNTVMSVAQISRLVNPGLA